VVAFWQLVGSVVWVTAFLTGFYLVPIACFIVLSGTFLFVSRQVGWLATF
jgi:hypothetical protein